MSKKTARVALMGLLTALMLILGYVESRIPVLISVPGVKLGLSNSVLLYALLLMGWKEAWLLMLTKVLLSCLLFGSPAVLIYSLAGGALSLIAMTLLRGRLGVIGVSAVGAVAHNLGQLMAAYLMGFAPLPALAYYFGVLTLAALVTGCLTGLIAGLVMKRVKPIG